MLKKKEIISETAIVEAEKTRKKEISKLLTETPLYTSVELSEFYPEDNKFLNRHTFNFFCKEENSTQTFMLQVLNENMHTFHIPERSSAFGGYISGQLLSFTDYCQGVCTSCQKYRVDFLINLYSKNAKQVIKENMQNGENKQSMFLRKLGQFPPYEIKPEKEILDYLEDEDCDFYKKALMNISHGYGVGAFAYFRRIIENEIKRIIKDISTFSKDAENKISEAILKYEKDHQMSSLIDELNKYLPETLKSIGDNPIKLLYEQLSIGLHGLSEAECLKKALLIDVILKFVIKQINAEKTELKAIREAVKSLKG